MPVKNPKATYRCFVCRKMLNSEEKLKQHSRKHLKDRPFACHICHATFKSAASLKRHANEVHATEKKFACPNCDKKFSCSDYLRKHSKSHDHDQSVNKKKQSKVASPALPKRSQSATKNRTDLPRVKLQRLSIKKHTPRKVSAKSGKKLKQQQRKTKKSAARSVSTAASAPTKVRTSRKRLLSGNNSADDNSADDLNQQPEPETKKIRTSGDFENGTTDDKSLTNGFAAAPPVPEETFTCPKCAKPFNNRADFERHAWCHIPPDLYSCDRCEERFVSSSLLAEHSAVHVREKESAEHAFQKDIIGVIKYYIRNQSDFCGSYYSNLMAEFGCNLCNLVYNEEADLRQHVKKTHRNGTLTQVYCCTLCSPTKTYKKEYNYQAHFEYVHEKQAGSCYVCAHCDKSFTYKVNLQSHIKHDHATNVGGVA